MILLVIETLGIKVEVDRETNTIGTKIAIDVTVEIKVSDNVDLLCDLMVSLSDRDCNLYIRRITF